MAESKWLSKSNQAWLFARTLVRLQLRTKRLFFFCECRYFIYLLTVARLILQNRKKEHKCVEDSLCYDLMGSMTVFINYCNMLILPLL